MNTAEIPSLTLPFSNYYSMVTMNNHSLVGILRKHVLSHGQMRRFTPAIPEEHDSYHIRRQSDCIIINMFHNGDNIYRFIIVPPTEY